MVTKELSKRESDYLRGIAALFVVIAHFCQWYSLHADAGIICMLLTKLGRYGVSIFFAVSGYGLVCSAQKGLDKTFIIRRLLNVYVPYLVLTGITSVLSGTQWNLTIVLRWLLGLDTWFVFVIMLFYLLFYFAWKNCKRKILVLHIGILLISILLAIATKDSTWYSSNFSFGVGILAKVYWEKFSQFVSKNSLFYFAMTTLFFAVSAVVYMMAQDRNQMLYILFKVLASVLWAILVLSVVTQVEVIYGKCICLLGVASLECYLLHSYVLTTIAKMVKEPILVIGISFVITAVVSYVIHVGYVRLLARWKR